MKILQLLSNFNIGMICKLIKLFRYAKIMFYVDILLCEEYNMQVRRLASHRTKSKRLRPAIKHLFCFVKQSTGSKESNIPMVQHLKHFRTDYLCICKFQKQLIRIRLTRKLIRLFHLHLCRLYQKKNTLIPMNQFHLYC